MLLLEDLVVFLRPLGAFLPCFFLVFLRPCRSFGLGLFAFLTGFAEGDPTVLPAPENVKLDGGVSFGAFAGVEHASPSHSTGRGGWGCVPPPIRAS